MKIVVDAMGGDNAPQVNVQGAIAALRAYPDLEICLIGQEEAIRPCLGDYQDIASRLEIAHAPEVIGMHDAPVLAIRRKVDSSIVQGLLRVKEGKADAFVSAGSTGAVLAGGMFRVGRIEGIERPCLGALLPLRHRSSILVDTGANVDCQPDWLVQFALMGAVYMERVQGIERPEVALINIGVEDEKGNELAKKAHALLAQGQPFHFIGNVEPRDIPEGVADVLVADGFVGNMLLKFLEGMAKTLFGMIKEGLMSSLRGKMGALLAKPVFARIKGSMDATEVGGAPLLGVEGVVIKAHGNSNARAMFCAIRQARTMVERQVVRHIREGVGQLKQSATE